MTREDIIKLAKECGNWSGQTVEMNDVGLERFANFVAAAEREACAQVCDEIANKPSNVVLGVAVECAEAIRARGKKCLTQR
jgi:hypothetical protein